MVVDFLSSHFLKVIYKEMRFEIKELIFREECKKTNGVNDQIFLEGWILPNFCVPTIILWFRKKRCAAHRATVLAFLVSLRFEIKNFLTITSHRYFHSGLRCWSCFSLTIPSMLWLKRCIFIIYKDKGVVMYKIKYRVIYPT